MNRRRSNQTKIKQRIASLEQQSQIIKDELELEFGKTTRKLGELSKIALGVGGGILISRLVLRGLAGKPKHKQNKISERKPGSKKVYQRFRDELFTELSFQATKYLLNIAKEMMKPHDTIKHDAGEDDTKGAY